MYTFQCKTESEIEFQRSVQAIYLFLEKLSIKKEDYVMTQELGGSLTIILVLSHTTSLFDVNAIKNFLK